MSAGAGWPGSREGLMIVVLDEGIDALPEIIGQVVVFQQDAVLEGLVPALNLALDLRSLHLASDN